MTLAQPSSERSACDIWTFLVIANVSCVLFAAPVSACADPPLPADAYIYGRIEGPNFAFIDVRCENAGITLHLECANGRWLQRDLDKLRRCGESEIVYFDFY